MKEKWTMWQVGWEHEKREVELDLDGAECPVCRVSKAVPGVDPMVFGYVKVGAEQSETTFVFMEALSPFPGLCGWLCREAKAEEIVRAEEVAKLVREGKIQEVAPKRAAQDHMARLKEELADARYAPLLLDAAEMLLSPSSWAARKGAEMGTQWMKRKKNMS